jgi:integrase
VAGQFRQVYLPSRAPKTQKDYGRHLDNLIACFGDSGLDTIEPADVAEYRDCRSAKVQANRELALLSALWNWAREKGYTELANPVSGIKRNSESGRSNIMTDAQYDSIFAAADQTVRDAMQLARVTGARISDLLNLRRTDVRDGELVVRQSKTGEPVRFRLTGKLKPIVDELLTRPRSATGAYLIQDDRGQHIPYFTFADRFERARSAAGYGPNEVQFRDIRPKVASELDDPKRAQEVLGHKHLSTTERHYRRIGKLVDPAE